MPPHVVDAAARAAERPAYAPTLGAPALREAIAAELSASSAGRSIRSATCSSRSAGCRRCTSRRSASARASVSHAPSFFFPQVVAAAGGAARDRRRRRPPDWDAFAAAIDARDDARDREHAGEPDRLRLPRAATSTRSRPRSPAADALLLSDEAYAGILYDGLEHLSPAVASRAARAHARPAQLLEDLRDGRVARRLRGRPGGGDRSDGARASPGRRSRSTASPRPPRTRR